MYRVGRNVALSVWWLCALCNCKQLTTCAKCRKAHKYKAKKYAKLGIVISELPPRVCKPSRPPQPAISCYCGVCKKCRHREYMREWRKKRDPMAPENVAARLRHEKLVAMYNVYRQEVLR